MADNWLAEAKRNGCGILPREAELTLMRASTVGQPDSYARRRAIDGAYSSTSRNYPNLFKY